MVKRFEVFMLNLDPVIGKDPKNTRLCLVVSPDEMNDHLETVIVAPITAESPGYPTRMHLELLGKARFVALDQIRTVEMERLFKKVGEAGNEVRKNVILGLSEMFAE